LCLTAACRWGWEERRGGSGTVAGGDICQQWPAVCTAGGFAVAVVPLLK